MSEIADVAERAMAETAGGAEIFDLKVNYMSGHAPGGDLVATARIVHSGRRTIVAECRVTGADGRLVATASGTFAVAREKED